MSLDSLTIAAATPDQARITRINTFPYWGAPRGFSKESYVKRDELMEQEQWGADGFLTTWVLVPRDDLKTTTHIFSHVETYRRTAIVQGPTPGSSGLEVISYGVASVYTPEQHRKKGYGKRMLQLLHYVLAPPDSLPPFPPSLGAPPPETRPDRSRDGAFSVLYSDIGRDFYANCLVGNERPGWVEQGSRGRCWVLDASDAVDEASDGENVQWLGRDEIEAMEASVAEVIKAKVASTSSDKLKVAFLPTGGLLSLHALRHVLSEPSLVTPPSFGFHRPSSSSSLFYTYSDETKGHQTLLILALVGRPSWADVVRAARNEGCDRVEIWGDDEVSRAWKEGKGVQVDRDDHLASLCYYGKEGSQGVDWLFNEKYAWC